MVGINVTSNSSAGSSNRSQAEALSKISSQVSSIRKSQNELKIQANQLRQAKQDIIRQESSIQNKEIKLSQRAKELQRMSQKIRTQQANSVSPNSSIKSTVKSAPSIQFEGQPSSKQQEMLDLIEIRRQNKGSIIDFLA